MTPTCASGCLGFSTAQLYEPRRRSTCASSPSSKPGRSPISLRERSSRRCTRLLSSLRNAPPPRACSVQLVGSTGPLCASTQVEASRLKRGEGGTATCGAGATREERPRRAYASPPPHTHGQQSAAKGSSTTVSRSDINAINSTLDSSALGLVSEVALNWLFPYPLITPRL